MNTRYNIFISHSWAYSDAYEKLLKLLDKDTNFTYFNYSVPKDDPIHTNGSDKELYNAIKEQMSHARRSWRDEHGMGYMNGSYGSNGKNGNYGR